MRSALLLIAIAACGGSKPPPPAPPPARPAPAAQPAQPAPAPVAEAPPEKPAPPPEKPAPPPVAETKPLPPRKSLYERLRDTDGKVPGLPGFAIKRKVDKTYCGGIKIITTRSKSVAKDDEPLAAVYKLEFPKGLSFDPDPKNDTKRKASLKKVDELITQLTLVGGDARKFYEQKFTSDNALATKAVAAARLAQVYQRLASTLARAEIPLDVRTGDFVHDKIEAFCDSLLDKAEPIAALAEQAATACAEKAKSVDEGWWNEVCVAP
ncbi:MAG TPA: hypothetical protein VFV99_26555 [Kofleriaceae bacterium]|nr:hypothetical protein [Kofleriaceae bacterium]